MKMMKNLHNPFIELEGAVNVRDLGNYLTTENRVIKPHRLIRGAALNAVTDHDKVMIHDTLNIRRVVDFRTLAEISELPNQKIEGVEDIHIAVMTDLGHGASLEDIIAEVAKAPESNDYLLNINRRLVTDESAQTGYRAFMHDLLATPDTATYWHCAAGKDRTGFAAALVLKTLAVDNKTILRDYLLSNPGRAVENERMMSQILAITPLEPVVAQAIKRGLEVNGAYILNALETMDNTFGSVENYLSEVIGFSKKDIIDFKKIYLK